VGRVFDERPISRTLGSSAIYNNLTFNEISNSSTLFAHMVAENNVVVEHPLGVKSDQDVQTVESRALANGGLRRSRRANDPSWKCLEHRAFARADHRVVARWLKRLGVGRLRALTPGPPVIRDQRDRPDKMNQLDIKKPGGFDQSGDRV
jgi:hypothetical protein